MVISAPVQRGVLVLRVSTQLMVVHRWWHHCSTIQHGSSQLLVVRMQGGVVALQHNTPFNKSSLVYSHHNWSCLCKQLIAEGRTREQEEALFRDVSLHLCSLVSCLSFLVSDSIYGMVLYKGDTGTFLVNGWFSFYVFWNILEQMMTAQPPKSGDSPAVCLEGITVLWLSTCWEEGTAAGTQPSFGLLIGPVSQ